MFSFAKRVSRKINRIISCLSVWPWPLTLWVGGANIPLAQGADYQTVKGPSPVGSPGPQRWPPAPRAEATWPPAPRAEATPSNPTGLALGQGRRRAQRRSQSSSVARRLSSAARRLSSAARPPTRPTRWVRPRVQPVGSGRRRWRCSSSSPPPARRAVVRLCRGPKGWAVATNRLRKAGGGLEELHRQQPGGGHSDARRARLSPGGCLQPPGGCLQPPDRLSRMNTLPPIDAPISCSIWSSAISRENEKICLNLW